MTRFTSLGASNPNPNTNPIAPRGVPASGFTMPGAGRVCVRSVNVHFTLPRPAPVATAFRALDSSPPFLTWRRRPLLFLACLSLMPVLWMLIRSAFALRNVAYWDEVETALALLLRVDAGASFAEIFERIFAVSNEHRTVTSRLLFLGSYWLTGTVNFTVLGAIGIGFICGACAVLVRSAGNQERQVRMLMVLAFVLFQLQHFENFFWAGSSIDHFQIVLLASGALAALAGGTRGGLLWGIILAILATLTLAHGLMVWPAGALSLLLQRRQRALAVWLALAGLIALLFFHGYYFNPGHHVGSMSGASLWRVLQCWLTLLGAPLSLNHLAVAPFLGLGLLAWLGRVAWHRGCTREVVAVTTIAWAAGSLLLVAIGRANVSDQPIYSRYYVLSGLVWALVLFLELERWHAPARPSRLLAQVMAGLALFNLAASASFAQHARSWEVSRDSALDNYQHQGRDGTGLHALYPNFEYSSSIIRSAEEKGIFKMPCTCQRVELPRARLVDDVLYYVDRMQVTPEMIAVEGWAALPGQISHPGQVHLILRSAKSNLIYTTIPVERKDVTAAVPDEAWTDSGFRFQQRRWLLPAEEYQVGLLIRSEHGDEYVMTAHRLDLRGEGRALLANEP